MLNSRLRLSPLQAQVIRRLIAVVTGNMPVVVPQHDPNHRFMVIAFEHLHRCNMVFVSGVCTLVECRAFAEECNAFHMARARDFFEHEVEVTSMGFTIIGEMPKLLAYYCVTCTPPPWCQFTDPYTYYVSKHSIEKYTRQRQRQRQRQIQRLENVKPAGTA